MDTASIILLSIIGVYVIIQLLRFLNRLGIKHVLPGELDNKKGIMLLDVRTDQEYKRGHIPGAVHVPFEQIGDRIKKLKKDKELVVYDQSGTRSIWAIKRLMGMGYKNLYNLKGGYSAWKKLHY